MKIGNLLIKYLKYIFNGMGTISSPVREITIDTNDILQSKFTIDNSKITSDKSEVVLDNNVKRVNLDQDVLSCVENLCSEIYDIINDASNETDILSQANNKIENLRIYVIFDLCRIFYDLNISIYDNKIERDILLVACGYFFEPKITYDSLNNDFVCYEKFIDIIDKYLCSPHPLDLDTSITPFVLPELFKKHDSLFDNYKNKLRDFAALITTIDYKLTKNESKILELIRKL